MKKQYLCCFEMKKHIEEKEVAIEYCNSFRSYGIKVLDGGSSVQRINFCPWCGKKLPRELGTELSKIVFEELKLDGYDDSRLPAEFQSDEWWKTRAL